MPRPALPLLVRLLPKIQVPDFPNSSHLESFVKIPIEEWPSAVREPPWRWIGGASRPCTVNNRARGRLYYQRRPPLPSFKVDGKRVQVHRLVYEQFVGPARSLRYRASPADFLDVNPAHWEPRDERRIPAPNSADEGMQGHFDPELAGLAEILEERFSFGRPLTLNLFYSVDMVEKALDLTGLRPIYEAQIKAGRLPLVYQPME